MDQHVAVFVFCDFVGDKNMDAETPLLKTPLYDLHLAKGGKMVPFAGYAMPVQYEAGIMAEHKHTRAAAGLFDVSHMGQAFLEAEAGIDEDIAALLERLVPGNLQGLAPGAIRYTLLLNEAGGIRDDLMVTRPSDPALNGKLYLVVNAACKEADFAHIETSLKGQAKLTRLEDRALVALQGPRAVAVLERLLPGVSDLEFMHAGNFDWQGGRLFVSRSGYTGEDGCEISVPENLAKEFAETLLGEEEVELIGLGARDSLRLEAGLCLYGHDIDTETTLVEASLGWTLPKRRREEANFPGAEIILKQLAEGVARKRVGLRPIGRAPAREGTEICNGAGEPIGIITSGGFGPSANGPVAMGYVASGESEVGTKVQLNIRGKMHPAEIVSMPFVTKNYAK